MGGPYFELVLDLGLITQTFQRGINSIMILTYSVCFSGLFETCEDLASC